VLLEDLRRAGARRLRARFEKTEKNEPARGFLPGHGFRDEGAGRFVLDPLPPEATPFGPLSHLQIVRGAAADGERGQR
jgi:hypothetical protein